MSKLLTNEDLLKLHNLYGHTLVDQAFRYSLIKHHQLGVNDSLASALVSQRNLIADLQYDSLLSEIDLLLKIGKPLAPSPPIPGAEPILGTKVSIQGNPPQLDVLYAGGWHFAQDNGWDAWFTFVALDTGGFRVANPACRLTGDFGAAIRGYETLAQFAGFPAPENLTFQITWFNGTVGNYQGKYSEISKTFLGNAGGPVLFEGTRMPADKVSPPSIFKPVISCQAILNAAQDGYTVTVSGAGLTGGDSFEVQGRTEGLGFSGAWGLYAEGTADILGAFSVTFGVLKPLGLKYIFRAITGSSGATVEVGFS